VDVLGVVDEHAGAAHRAAVEAAARTHAFGQGRADVDRQVIQHTLNPYFLSEMSCYDVASNIRQPPYDSGMQP